MHTQTARPRPRAWAQPGEPPSNPPSDGCPPSGPPLSAAGPALVSDRHDHRHHHNDNDNHHNNNHRRSSSSRSSQHRTLDRHPREPVAPSCPPPPPSSPPSHRPHSAVSPSRSSSSPPPPPSSSSSSTPTPSATTTQLRNGQTRNHTISPPTTRPKPTSGPLSPTTAPRSAPHSPQPDLSDPPSPIPSVAPPPPPSSLSVLPHHHHHHHQPPQIRYRLSVPVGGRKRFVPVLVDTMPVAGPSAGVGPMAAYGASPDSLPVFGHHVKSSIGSIPKPQQQQQQHQHQQQQQLQGHLSHQHQLQDQLQLQHHLPHQHQHQHQPLHSSGPRHSISASSGFAPYSLNSRPSRVLSHPHLHFNPHAHAHAHAHAHQAPPPLAHDRERPPGAVSKSQNPSGDEPSSTATLFCICQPDPKIPRPRNAFILYRQHFQASIAAQNPGLPNPEISKIIGERWRGEDEDVKDKWRELAEIERNQHQQRYPTYKYRPRRNGRRSVDFNARGSVSGVGPGGGPGGFDPDAHLDADSSLRRFVEIDPTSGPRCCKCGGYSLRSIAAEQASANVNANAGPNWNSGSGHPGPDRIEILPAAAAAAPTSERGMELASTHHSPLQFRIDQPPPPPPGWSVAWSGVARKLNLDLKQSQSVSGPTSSSSLSSTPSPSSFGSSGRAQSMSMVGNRPERSPVKTVSMGQAGMGPGLVGPPGRQFSGVKNFHPGSGGSGNGPADGLGGEPAGLGVPRSSSFAPAPSGSGQVAFGSGPGGSFAGPHPHPHPPPPPHGSGPLSHPQALGNHHHYLHRNPQQQQHSLRRESLPAFQHLPPRYAHRDHGPNSHQSSASSSFSSISSKSSYASTATAISSSIHSPSARPPFSGPASSRLGSSISHHHHQHQHQQQHPSSHSQRLSTPQSQSLALPVPLVTSAQQRHSVAFPLSTAAATAAAAAASSSNRGPPSSGLLSDIGTLKLPRFLPNPGDKQQSFHPCLSPSALPPLRNRTEGGSAEGGRVANGIKGNADVSLGCSVGPSSASASSSPSSSPSTGWNRDWKWKAASEAEPRSGGDDEKQCRGVGDSHVPSFPAAASTESSASFRRDSYTSSRTSEWSKPGVPPFRPKGERVGDLAGPDAASQKRRESGDDVHMADAEIPSFRVTSVLSTGVTSGAANTSTTPSTPTIGLTCPLPSFSSSFGSLEAMKFRFSGSGLPTEKTDATASGVAPSGVNSSATIGGFKDGGACPSRPHPRPFLASPVKLLSGSCSQSAHPSREFVPSLGTGSGSGFVTGGENDRDAGDDERNGGGDGNGDGKDGGNRRSSSGSRSRNDEFGASGYGTCSSGQTALPPSPMISPRQTVADPCRRLS